jgi:serine/threonine protein kinase
MTVVSILTDNWRDMDPDPTLKAHSDCPQGAFGTIEFGTIKGRKGQRRSWKARDVAAKVLKKEGLQEKLFVKELEVMASVNHPNCMRIRAVSFLQGKRKILMNRMPETLDHLIFLKSQERHPEQWNDTAQSCTILGIAAGLAYLHKMNIVHRDIKPANVLMDKDYRPKISDFGLSKLIPIGTQMSGEGAAGTLPYMAPELLSPNPTLDKTSVDVYAFGVTVWGILTSEKPFAVTSGSISRLEDDIVNQNRRPDTRTIKADDLRALYTPLLGKWWHQDPDVRGTMVDILKDADRLMFPKADPKVFADYKARIFEAMPELNA